MTATSRVAPTSDSVTRRPSRIRRWFENNSRVILNISGILMILIPWELAVRIGFAKEILISSPTAVAEAFVTEFGQNAIWRHLWATFRVWIVGFTLASAIGIVLGLLAGWYRRAGLIAVPALQFAYAAPNLAFVPIFILWFGLGLVFKVWVVFLGVVIYVTLNTIAGVQATENRFLAVARTYGASQTTIFRSIVVPGAMPYIMTGLRIASGRAIVGVVGAEFVSANEGIGFLITVAGSTFQTARVFVGVIILGAFGVLLNELLGLVERRFEPWRADVHA